MINGKSNYEKFVSINFSDRESPSQSSLLSSVLSSSLSKKSSPEQLRNGRKDLLKYASLVTLTVQNAALALMMRAARTQKELFISSTAVIMSEVIKLITCLVMVRIDEGNTKKLIMSIKTHIIDQPTETLKVAVPSIVYYIQNNLLYVGATHLDAATSQVTYQLKILTTAIFSVVLLNKKLFLHQWFSLLILFIGVALVQLVQINKVDHKSGHESSKVIDQSITNEQSPLIGFLAILLACVLSGFAGVYFEKILKSSSEVSLWIRNIQLSAIAIPFGLIQVFISDYDVMAEKGFFYGYSLITWIVILLQAQGGLLVAVVVKYADNILKGFATSFAIILACVVSVYVFGFVVTGQFVIGTVFVICSIFLYSKPPSNSNVSKLSDSVHKA